MYEKLEVCPVCKNSDFINHLICTDHSITGESFALNKCRKCKLIFTNPRPSEASLPKYYQSDDYISHSNKSSNLINLAYKLVRRYTIRKKVKLLKKYTSGKSILDYGCGTGDFLLACKLRGFHVEGFEPNHFAREQSVNKGIEVITDLKATKQKVDIITAWHVIEHVSELKKTIKLLKKKLNEDGLLIIAVPNINSYDSIHYKEHWAALDVPRHLYHFSQESFGTLLAKTKLQLVDTVPMYFDSYYVSILSEKYLHGKTNFLKAIKIGRKSNQLAKKSGEYSSLIYIIRK